MSERSPAARLAARRAPLPVRLLAAGGAALMAGILLLAAPARRAPAARAAAQLNTRHPLDALTAAEMASAVGVLQGSGKVPPGSLMPLLALREPPKEEVLRYQPGASFRREALAILLERARGQTFEAVVDLIERKLLTWTPMPGVQPPVTATEFAEVNRIVRADPRWQAAIRARGINDPDSVSVDAWAAGEVRPGDPAGARLVRAVSYYAGRSFNYYGRPIEGVVAMVDLTRGRVVQVVDSGVVPVPRENGELDERTVGRQREAPKPLTAVQALGKSFQVLGHEVRWQKWRFRFALHPREGLVLYTVGYEDGNRVRPVLYRASLSEMVVPYADPDPNWTFRTVFDLGEYGFGRFVSPMVPGNDAPDNAAFFDATLAGETGVPYTVPRAVALYERDGGILWRHGGPTPELSESRRARELVVTTIATLGNYDYVLNWIFHQDGTLETEMLLTGIMIAKGTAATTTPPHGQGREETAGHLVAPNLVAVNHQHFFNFRLDLDVDGALPNQVIEVDSRPLAAGPQNPAGNAFSMVETPLVSELQGRRDLDPAASRRWKIINPAARNSLGRPVGYMLLPGENAVPLAQPPAILRRRAGFTEHPLWVTHYDPAEFYAAGDYVNQSVGGEGLPKWTRADRSIKNEDLVLWYTMGVTHLPRPEEWPVMPAHRAGFRLVPADFFSRNPALDVPRVR